MKFKKFILDLTSHYSEEVKSCISDLKTKGKRKLQIPNILTASRIVAPIFILPFVLTSNLVGAAIVTGCFAITDCFDGMLARKLNATSEFGRELDPIADKFFAGGLMIPLIINNPLLIFTFVLEGVIAGVNSYSKYKQNSPRTNYIGKIKTWALSILMMTSYYSMFSPVNSLATTIPLVLTNILQIGAVTKYIVDDKKKDNIRNNQSINNIETQISQKNKSEKNVKKEKIDLLKTQKNILINDSKLLNTTPKTLKKQ